MATGNIAEGKIIVPKNVNRNFSVNGIEMGYQQELTPISAHRKSIVTLTRQKNGGAVKYGTHAIMIYQRENLHSILQKSLIDLYM